MDHNTGVRELPDYRGLGLQLAEPKAMEYITDAIALADRLFETTAPQREGAADLVSAQSRQAVAGDLARMACRRRNREFEPSFVAELEAHAGVRPPLSRVAQGIANALRATHVIVQDVPHVREASVAAQVVNAAGRSVDLRMWRRSYQASLWVNGSQRVLGHDRPIYGFHAVVSNPIPGDVRPQHFAAEVLPAAAFPHISLDVTGVTNRLSCSSPEPEILPVRMSPVNRVHMCTAEYIATIALLSAETMGVDAGFAS